MPVKSFTFTAIILAGFGLAACAHAGPHVHGMMKRSAMDCGTKQDESDKSDAEKTEKPADHSEQKHKMPDCGMMKKEKDAAPASDNAHADHHP